MTKLLLIAVAIAGLGVCAAAGDKPMKKPMDSKMEHAEHMENKADHKMERMEHKMDKKMDKMERKQRKAKRMEDKKAKHAPHEMAHPEAAAEAMPQ